MIQTCFTSLSLYFTRYIEVKVLLRSLATAASCHFFHRSYAMLTFPWTPNITLLEDGLAKIICDKFKTPPQIDECVYFDSKPPKL